MNNSKDIKLTHDNNHLQYSKNNSHTISNSQARYSLEIIKKNLPKRSQTQVIDQNRDWQEVQSLAKDYLFEQSQVHHQKQLKKYERQHKNLLSEQDITAFENGAESMRRDKIFIESLKQSKFTENKLKRKASTNTELLNNVVYWNKKQSAQVMILKPTVLNPNLTIQLSHDECSLLVSPKANINHIGNSQQNCKDFEAVIKSFAKKTKYMSKQNDLNEFPEKEKDSYHKTVALSRKLVKFRSKSINFVQQDYQASQILNDLEKISSKCKLNIEAKSFNLQKYENDRKNEVFTSNSKQLKERIKNLISCEANQMGCLKQQNEHISPKQQKSFIKIEKFKDAQNRSQSCFVSTFKGPINKKLKMVSILRKLSKTKTTQLQNRRKIKLSQVSNKNQINKSIQFLKIRSKTTELSHIEDKPISEKIFKISHPTYYEGSKKSLASSIKTFCQDKNKSQLPFMSILLKKSAKKRQNPIS